MLVRGDVWLANLNPGRGTEPGKTRPVLLVQAASLLRAGHPSSLIVPLTTNLIDLSGNAADMLAHLPAGREALQQRIPERTLSRIHEMCRVVHLEGEDYRRRHR